MCLNFRAVSFAADAVSQTDVDDAGVCFIFLFHSHVITDNMQSYAQKNVLTSGAGEHSFPNVMK